MVVETTFDYSSKKIAVRRIRLAQLKEIIMFSLLHLNEDFDDDLLLDIISLTEHRKEWFDKNWLCITLFNSYNPVKNAIMIEWIITSEIFASPNTNDLHLPLEEQLWAHPKLVLWKGISFLGDDQWSWGDNPLAELNAIITLDLKNRGILSEK